MREGKHSSRDPQAWDYTREAEIDRQLAGIARAQERERAFDAGIDEGKKLGVEEYQRSLQQLTGQLIQRFGALPAWAQLRLLGMSSAALDGIRSRLDAAQSLEEALGDTDPT